MSKSRSDWRKSARYQIGGWLVQLGQKLIRSSEQREIVARVIPRLRVELRDLPRGPDRIRRAKDIAAEETTKFFIEKQRIVDDEGLS